MEESLLDLEIKQSLESSFLAAMKRAKTFGAWKTILDDNRVTSFLEKPIPSSFVLGKTSTDKLPNGFSKLMGGRSGGTTHTLNTLLHSNKECTFNEMLASVQNVPYAREQLRKYLKRYMTKNLIRKVSENDDGGTYEWVKP